MCIYIYIMKKWGMKERRAVWSCSEDRYFKENKKGRLVIYRKQKGVIKITQKNKAKRTHR